PEFHELQYTFLSQVRHRDDLRHRLAGLYGEWRTGMSRDMTEPDGLASASVSARTFSTFVQALLHGLALQRVPDPASYPRHEMLAFTLHLFSSIMGHADKPAAHDAPAPSRPRKKANLKEPT